MFYGNLKLASSMLFAGTLCAQALSMFKHAKVPVFCKRTYCYLQKAYLIPAINNVWTKENSKDLEALKKRKKPLKLAGDARCGAYMTIWVKISIEYVSVQFINAISDAIN